MPYDTNGNATVTRDRAVTGQKVQAAQVNVPFDDVQAMLSQVLLRSGIAPMLANLNFNSFKGVNVAASTADGETVEHSQLQAVISSVTSLDTTLRALITASSIPTGQRGSFFMQSAPAGWVLANGGTIGSAASGATTRANADTEALFTLFWNSFTNGTLPIRNPDGSVSSRGASAAVDFAANKRLTVFDLRTRYDRGADLGLGFDTALFVGTTQADSVGPHKHTLPRTSIDTSGVDTAHSVGNAAGTLATSTTDSTIGAETRPRTVASLPCIKL